MQDDAAFRERVRKQQEEWDNSLEGIRDQIRWLWAKAELEEIIVKTVQRLPPEVRQFVYDKCSFHAINTDGGHALAIKANVHLDWIILLGEAADEAVVAHEIAHCVLGHRFPLDGFSTVEEVGPLEMAANYKAKEWGFDVQSMIDRDIQQFRIPDGGNNV